MRKLRKYILSINAGSATIKFGIFDYYKPIKKLKSGVFERVGQKNSFLKVGKVEKQFVNKMTYFQSLQAILSNLKLDISEIELVAHRVVHGGEMFTSPVLVTKRVWRQISNYNDLAPLHNPVNLSLIKACYSKFPQARNIAVFDTAFFSTLEPEYYLYALPYELYKKYKVRRYGFHGISHQAAAKEAAAELSRPLSSLNIIAIHLGSGCSIAAIKKGRALKTSFGFTPLEGLVMGTRCGDLDPAIPLYLQEKLKISPAKAYDLLNRKSGLLGLSGFTSDMREILKAAGKKVLGYHGRKKFTEKQKKRASLALEVFISRLRGYILLYLSLLERVDAVVFTGAIGQRSPVIRQLAMKGINFLSRPKIMVAKADEEAEIAKQAKKYYTKYILSRKSLKKNK